MNSIGDPVLYIQSPGGITKTAERDSIDTIAGLLPYSRYEQAETALSLQAGGGVGGRVGLFRDHPTQGSRRPAATRSGQLCYLS